MSMTAILIVIAVLFFALWGITDILDRIFDLTGHGRS